MGFYLKDRVAAQACTPEPAPPRLASGVSGLRYYSPKIGRWLNRDPIGDTSFRRIILRSSGLLFVWSAQSSRDAAHVYRFIVNRAVCAYDVLGLTEGSEQCCPDKGDDYDPCRAAPVPPNEWFLPPERRATGFVVCWHGKPYSCVNEAGIDAVYKNATARQIIRKCVTKHGGRHHQDTECPRDNCEPQRMGPKEGVDRDAGECNAYIVEWECYADSLEECGADVDCEREVRKEFDRINRLRAEYCGEVRRRGTWPALD